MDGRHSHRSFGPHGSPPTFPFPPDRLGTTPPPTVDEGRKSSASNYGGQSSLNYILLPLLFFFFFFFHNHEQLRRSGQDDPGLPLLPLFRSLSLFSFSSYNLPSATLTEKEIDPRSRRAHVWSQFTTTATPSSLPSFSPLWLFPPLSSLNYSTSVPPRSVMEKYSYDLGGRAEERRGSSAAPPPFF